jgi:hypothetical protein
MEKYGEWEERLEIFHLQEREGVRILVETNLKGGQFLLLGKDKRRK